MTKWIIAAMATIASFGTWESPISTELLVKDARYFNEMRADGKRLLFTERRPSEKGRVAFVDAASFEDVLPEASIRTRVHEYGGGAFALKDNYLYFVDDQKRALCIQKPDQSVKVLLGDENHRYADMDIFPGGKKVICVAEIHSADGIENCLVQITDEGEETRLASGHDFFASPRFSPDGKKIAFFTWDLPNMPWDGSTLWLADIEGDTLSNKRVIAGGPDESVCQIAFSPEGDLYYASDKTGFWNLYRNQQEPLFSAELEFGTPHWVFGTPVYAFTKVNGQRVLACIYVDKGIDKIGFLFPDEKRFEPLDLPFTDMHEMTTWEDRLVFFAAWPEGPLSLISLDPETKKWEILRQSFAVSFSEKWISTPEIITYPSLDGKEGYALYYPPKNPNFEAPKGEKPPLIVKCHGGPSAHSAAAFDFEVQFWTTRGFAFLDVNYGGSTGFGREYLKRLEGNWGVVDVEDAISATKTLLKQGLADEKKLFIRGGSAGGYTVLCALTFHDLFAGGASYYGISDLEPLYKDLHKFEAGYNDKLLGPYEEVKDKIFARSPLNFVHKINVPVLLLQGEEDKVVLPDQSEKIYEALKERGIPTELLLFKGEGHGFRQADTIKKAFETELNFYQSILRDKG